MDACHRSCIHLKKNLLSYSIYQKGLTESKSIQTHQSIIQGKKTERSGTSFSFVLDIYLPYSIKIEREINKNNNKSKQTNYFLSKILDM